VVARLLVGIAALVVVVVAAMVLAYRYFLHREEIRLERERERRAHVEEMVDVAESETDDGSVPESGDEAAERD
jgi:hypothetical protein